MENINITETEFQQIVKLLKENFGINLSQKKNLIVGRLQNHLHRSNYKSFSDYYSAVIADTSGEEITLLINKLTTNYTFFMREIEHFNYFRSTVLPHITATEKNKDMRIWSAACSSGEEPYSIVMCIDDYFAGKKNGWDTKVLATDISERVLSLASEGIYLTENTDPLPPAWRHNYFTRVDGENSQVIPRLRSEVIFRKFNLMERKLPFRKKFHIIWCRNVMIYFDAATKRELIERLYDATEPGGYLFIGHSESVSRGETRYAFVEPAIYRKE